MAGLTVEAAVAQRGRPTYAAGEGAADGPRPSPVRPLLVEKVVAEAGILLRCADLLRLADTAVGDVVDRLALELAPHARGESVLVRLCSEPACAIEHAACHLYLADMGHPDEVFGRFLKEIVDGDRAGGAERLPNHALEYHWLEQIRCGLAESPVDAALLARTCVASPLDVLGASTVDLYVFTHVVLYATDMGRRRVSWPRSVEEIAAEAQCALAAALDADNFDLAAELLWIWPMLGLPWNAAATFAFQVLASAQDEHGFLPGPEYASLASGTLDDDVVLRTSYHANIAMGILCAVALLPGRAPAQCLPEAPLDAHAVDNLLRLLLPSTRSPRWLALHAALEPARRAALAPFVLSIVLRRAAAANDIERVRSGLQAALEGGWAEGPGVRQALALLRRVTLLGRLRNETPATTGETCRRGMVIRNG
jgi:hypothetical protein